GRGVPAQSRIAASGGGPLRTQLKMSAKHFTSSAEQSTMRNLALTGLPLLAVLVLAGPAPAQESVDRTVPAPGTGSVEIANVAGEIRVVGWDRAEVRITGTLGEGTDRLDVGGSGDRVTIEVVIPRGARNVRGTNLEIRVPTRKDITVRGVSADVEVGGVTGRVDAQSTSGDVRVRGTPASVRSVSTSGAVDLEVNTTRVEAN